MANTIQESIALSLAKDFNSNKISKKDAISRLREKFNLSFFGAMSLFNNAFNKI